MKQPNNQNIITFPGTKKRLIEKGLDHLNQHHYIEAVDYLEQAYKMDTLDEETGQLLLVAYYENKDYSLALELASSFLTEGFHEYTDILNIYLLSLIQLHYHEEVYEVISMLKEENVLPKDKEEHFLTLMTMSKRMAKGKEDIEENDDVTFSSLPMNDQMVFIAGLGKSNCRPYVSELKKSLFNEDTHPFIQSMIVELFREQEITEECVCRKFGEEKTIVPAQLNNPFETPEAKTLLEEIEALDLASDPIFQEHLVELVKRHLFTTYPFHAMYEPAAQWAATYNEYVLNLFTGQNEGTDPEKYAIIVALEEKTLPNM